VKVHGENNIKLLFLVNRHAVKKNKVAKVWLHAFFCLDTRWK
jgi:hypothetical protein